MIVIKDMIVRDIVMSECWDMITMECSGSDDNARALLGIL